VDRQATRHNAHWLVNSTAPHFISTSWIQQYIQVKKLQAQYLATISASAVYLVQNGTIRIDTALCIPKYSRKKYLVNQNYTNQDRVIKVQNYSTGSINL